MEMSRKRSIKAIYRVAICLVFLICADFSSARSQPYTNLALEGGGIRGIAYAGAFEELDRRHMLRDVRQVAGTSVGAIAGCLLSVGYTPAGIRDILYSLKIQHFNDGGWSVLGGQARMRRHFGWYHGHALERWIERQIASRTGINGFTFGQLHALAQKDPQYKDLYVTAANLSRQQATVFCWQHYPDMQIATAVRASMSIPLYFRAMRLDCTGRKSPDGDVFVDGGLVMNYPLALFDSGQVNKYTLGLKLERPEQIPHFRESTSIAPYHIHNFRTYVGALYNLTIETLNRKAPMEEELFRTVYISTAGINPRVRKMSRDQKTLLYESGRQGVSDFFR
jgi:NTE family protein